MVFFCQRSCYEKEFVATVISCNAAKIKIITNGIAKDVDCFEVIFDDTIFFPEGGGQPYDQGHVNGIKVFKVLRKADKALHYLESPVEVHSTVTQLVDWSRRHDHMQQHSAQHLITAIADKHYGFPTLSWNLGEKISSIELDTTMMSDDQVAELEDSVNTEIRKSVPVTVAEFKSGDPQLLEIRSRGLPEDAGGIVRVVTIEGIDSNICCGTHVKNLSDIQAIKLLYVEKGKANKLLLYFVSGKRVLMNLGECVARERIMNTLLHSHPQEHIRLIEKCKKDLKQCNKSLSDAFRDLAIAEAYKFSLVTPKPKIFFHHRRDGDMDYLGTIIASIADSNVLKVLTAGDDNGPGILILHGPQDQISTISARSCEILDGKGGGKARFTAKVNKLGKRKDMEKYIRETLDIQ